MRGSDGLLERCVLRFLVYRDFVWRVAAGNTTLVCSKTIPASVVLTMPRPRKRPSHRHRLRAERLESRTLLAGDLGHNFLLPADVDGNDDVQPRDALAVINLLSAGDDSKSGRQWFADVNDDGIASPSDALRVINELALRQHSQPPLAMVLDGNGETRVRVELEVGQQDAELEVRMIGGPAGETLDVSIDGQVIGQLQTNDRGQGRLELELGRHGTPIPDVIRNATPQSVVSVGDHVQGVLAGSDDDSVRDDNSQDDNSQDDNSGSDSNTGGGPVMPPTGGVVMEAEPNNKQAFANTITLQADGTLRIEGVSTSKDDKDFFRLIAPTSGILKIEVSTDGGGLAQVEVTDAGGVELFETQPNDGIHSGSLTVVEGQSYFIRLRAKDDTAAAYVVSLEL